MAAALDRYVVVGIFEESPLWVATAAPRVPPLLARRSEGLKPSAGSRSRRRAHLRADRPYRALWDLPQIILTTYFLSCSFGDCLPEEGVALGMDKCKLTPKSALTVVLSLVTSAVYFGCT